MALVAVPLNDLNELLEWKVEGVSSELQKALDKICDIQLGDPGLRPQTLLCHDMKGGYIEDRFLEGCSDNEAYRFVHWHSIDWFVYFSHSFVTIPPPGWTAAAHTNGVPVLGTLITEGQPGQDLCKELFGSLKMVERCVVSLVNIARHHKLHGWLINIENIIDPVAVGLVVLFLQKLTAAMRTVTPCSRVVWYDSVTHEGKLHWQDQLNGQNSCFYEACDAIFLNYSWTVDQLRASREYARGLARRPLPGISTDDFGAAGGGGEGQLAGDDQRSLEAVCTRGGDQTPEVAPVDEASPQFIDFASEDPKSPASCGGEETKVFVGVDVFGRNFYEGGGFNCHKALDVIRSHGLSAAIFAPGWTHEVLGRSQFPANDTKFWGQLVPHLHEGGPSRYPLTSCFCDGSGCAFYGGGRVADPRPWYDLSRQDLLPSVTQGGEGCAVQYHHDDAYEGGSCLLLSNASEQRVCIPLWSNCRLQVCPTAPLQIELAYKWVGPNAPLGGAPLATLSRAEQSLDIDLCQDPPASSPNDPSGTPPASPPNDSPEAPDDEWLVRRWTCDAYDGVVSKIRVVLPRGSAVKLGRLHVDQLRGDQVHP